MDFKMRKKSYNTRFLVLITLYLITFANHVASERIQKSIDDSQDENTDSVDESKDESLDIPAENESNNLTCTRRLNQQIHEIRIAEHKQYPFMAAIMSQQNDYLCSGSVISNGVILTSAKCLSQPLSHVLLNATKGKYDETTVMVHVIKAEKFPSNTGSDSHKDVGIAYTEKFNNTVASKIKLSNYTASRNIVDFTGLGFGLNSEVDQTKELQYMGLEHRSIIEGSDIIKGYFDCVDTKILTCFKDYGGPIIYNDELIGIITSGQDECTKEMSSTYALNKLMIIALPTYTFKAWLDEKISKNEEQEATDLSTYPLKPVSRTIPMKSVMLSNNGNRLIGISVPIIFIAAFLQSIF